MLAIANKLLEKFGDGKIVHSVSDCNHDFFINIYEQMLNEKLPGLIPNAKEKEEQIHNIQVVVDLLATDVLDIDLSHIDAQSIVAGNEIHIQNLLEIFDGLYEFVLEELDKDEEENDLDDSNLIKEDHAILSDVFLEEFGHSYAERNAALPSSTLKAQMDLSPVKRAFHSEILNYQDNINTLQMKGNNSTNELILEAELLERQQSNKNKNKAAIEDEGDEGDWSGILIQTNSAVNSLNADVNEIGKRPRKQLGVETRKQNEEEDGAGGENSKQKEDAVRKHQHLHHHFHHQIDTSTSLDSSTSTSSSSSFKFKRDTKKSVLVGRDNNSSKDKSSLLVNSSVQTDENEHATNLPSHKEFLRSLHESSMMSESTRSRQLSELSNRLSTLRNELGESSSKGSAVSPEKKQKSSKGKENIPRVKKTNNQNKVSFATDVISHTTVPSYSSDTDIDYSSPVAKGKYKTQKHDKRNKFAELARVRFSSGEDDYIPVSKPRHSQRFDKHLAEKDERLKDLMMEYRANDVIKRGRMEKIRHDYSHQRHVLVDEKDEQKKQSNMVPKLPKRTGHSKRKSQRISTDNDYATRLAAIYKKPTRGRTTENKSRKRSASASPVGRRRFKSRMVLNEDEILPMMEDEFPFLHLSPHTAKLMWQKQMRQVNTLYKTARSLRPSKAQKQIEDAQKKQERLAKLIKKELDHNNRLKEYKDQQFQQGLVKKKLAERRHRSARARKYYDEYVIRNRSRMMNKRSKEEKIFKQLFEDGLEIQRERLRDIKKYSREQKEKNEEKQRNEIESMENFYRGQFSMLAETITQERQDVRVRQKAQNQLLHKMRKEMRQKMEKDIHLIQEQLINEQDTSSFRQIDADNMRKEFQLATFKSAKKY